MPPDGLEHTQKLSGITGVIAIGGAESGAVGSDSSKNGGASGPQQMPLDADLAEVVEAWPNLTSQVRAAVVAMVKPAGA